MQAIKSRDLTQGSIPKTLLKMTVPMLFGILSMVIFNLVDTLFVGWLGLKELAALSLTFPVVFLVMGLSLGLGVGCSAVISHAIGERDDHKVRRLTFDSLLLAVSIVAMVAFLGIYFMKPIFRAIGASAEMIPLIRQYMMVWFPGTIFVVVPMVGNNAIRATGDTVTPSIIMGIAVLINIVLDPILIFGWGPVPRLGLMGAALATVVARATTFSLSLYILIVKKHMLTWLKPSFEELISSWKHILFIGLPSGLTNVSISLAIGFVTRLVSAYGAAAVAAFGVATRLEMFSLAVIMALSTSLNPFVGQNLGGNKISRVLAGIRISQGFSILWGVLLVTIFWLASKPIAMAFNSDPEVISRLVLYLSIVPISYSLRGVLMLSTTVMNVLHKPIQAAILTLLQLFGVYLPLAIFFSKWFGLKGVFAATACASGIGGVVAFLLLKSLLPKVDTSV